VVAALSEGNVNLRNFIETTFDGRAFCRPLFYNYPGGLRFELSEGGTAIEQFLLAIQKAREICGDLFKPSDTIIVCLRRHTTQNESAFSLRPALSDLKEAGVTIPRERSIWTDPLERGDWFDENDAEFWFNVAFKIPNSLIQNLLWCAFAKDFGSIRPNPHGMVYFFNLEKRVMVFPYDDRGMDAVGPNHALLNSVFQKNRRYLLEYDLATMLQTFGSFDPTLTPSALE
jgi:hypothetical protein